MGRYTLIVTRPFFLTLRTFNREERTEIRRLLGLIQIDPSIDGVHKVVAPRPPAVFTAYVTNRFWIFYRVVGNVIHVESVDRATGRFPAPW